MQLFAVCTTFCESANKNGSISSVIPIAEIMYRNVLDRRNLAARGRSRFVHKMSQSSSKQQHLRPLLVRIVYMSNLFSYLQDESLNCIFV